MDKTIFRFSIEKINGQKISLSEYEGKVLLIVNTATECGLTPQLKELEELYRKYRGQDFEIIGIPSNDFGRQEPRQGEEITKFCRENYGVTFPIFSKTIVRGPYAHPLYKFLSDKKQNGKIKASPLWNFHKYLVDRNGQVTDFFYPFTKPTSLRVRKKINRLLSIEEPGEKAKSKRSK
ncbi:glutathione peroxidase [Anseongella ginsenosidimutans]|uniref:Glutathione peroxidase n=1 Tax=Anseongella ginsenosidimutans TaxID=496056 RepID=A0A4R3KSP8_9SPHI|nr:glutathione peroxidase [Anseongella ginsenosidimutans]QEC53274.1 glutathione peroxidase [Anseongella ginsenosidimutans]TCS88144.1 glutathione peroxidase [Anseongella ginsenosidimutans]